MFPGAPFAPSLHGAAQPLSVLSLTSEGNVFAFSRVEVCGIWVCVEGEKEAGGCAFLCSRRHRSLLQSEAPVSAALVLSDSLARLFLTTRSCFNCRCETETVGQQKLWPLPPRPPPSRGRSRAAVWSPERPWTEAQDGAVLPLPVVP